MITNLGQFIRERFTLKVSVALSCILFIAPLSLTNFKYVDIWHGFFSTFSFLLILRIFDDISDRQVDRITHPERGLVSGRINVKKLKYMAVIIGSLVFQLSFHGIANVDITLLHEFAGGSDGAEPWGECSS